MARGVVKWLGKKDRVARTVTLKVRYSDFTTITRSQTLATPTSDEETIASQAVALLERTEAGTRPVRLLGVGVHNFSRPGEEPPASTAPRRNEEPRLPFEE